MAKRKTKKIYHVVLYAGLGLGQLEWRCTVKATSEKNAYKIANRGFENCTTLSSWEFYPDECRFERAPEATEYLEVIDDAIEIIRIAP